MPPATKFFPNAGQVDAPGFDPNYIIAGLKARKERQTLSSIGKMLSSSNLSGAADAAFGAGKLDMGLAIQNKQVEAQQQAQAQAQQKQMRQAQVVAQFGRRALNNPEFMPTFRKSMIQMAQQQGPEAVQKITNATDDDIRVMVGQAEMMASPEFQKGLDAPQKPPKVETFFDDKGQPYKAQWNAKTGDWDQEGGSQAPKKGIRVKTADGTEINIGGSGPEYGPDPKLKKDFRMVKDSKGVETGAIEPMPGSETEKKWREAEERGVKKRLAAQRDSRIVLDYADRALKLIDDNPDTASGPVASAAQWIPGTAAFNAKQLIKTLQAKGAFDKLQEIRDNSKTGGAVGQLSDDERRALSDSMAQLEQAQSYEQLRYNMAQFRDRYLDAAYGDIEGVYGYTWVEIEAQMKRTGKTREQILDNIAENVAPRTQ